MGNSCTKPKLQQPIINKAITEKRESINILQKPINNELVKMIMEKENEISEDSLIAFVNQESFNEYFKGTLYYKNMAETPKSPSILKTLNDIFKILPMYRQKFMKFYCKYKTKPIKVVTKIWTYDSMTFRGPNIRTLINMALIIDAKETFKDDVINANSYLIEFLDQHGIEDVEKVIKYSAKFIKLLASAISNQGVIHNTEDRMTYKSIDYDLLEMKEDKLNYRIITWTSTFENVDDISKQQSEDSVTDNKDLTKKNSSNQDLVGNDDHDLIDNDKNSEDFINKSRSSIVKFNIPLGCYNAGKLNSIGKNQVAKINLTTSPLF